MQNDFYLAMPSLQGLGEIQVLKSQLILLLVAIYKGDLTEVQVPLIREKIQELQVSCFLSSFCSYPKRVSSTHQRPSSKHCKHYLLSFSSFSLVPCSNSSLTSSRPPSHLQSIITSCIYFIHYSALSLLFPTAIGLLDTVSIT